MSDARCIDGARAAMRVSQLHHALEAEGGVATPRAEALLDELVRVCLAMPAELAAQVLAVLGEEAQAILDLSVRTERALEARWAARVLESSTPVIELGLVPHLARCHRLLRTEMAVVASAGGPPTEMAVIGSGSLPLTAIGLALEHGMRCVAVDDDEARLAQGAAVLDALGTTAAVSYRPGDPTGDLPDLTAMDLVVLAGLAGETPHAKVESAAGVAARLRPGALLLVRTATGACSLLRAPVTADAICEAVPGLLEPVVEVHPHRDVVSSVLVLRRAGGQSA